MASGGQEPVSVWWYLLHTPDQYVLFANAPAWLAGAVLAVFSAILAAFGFVLLKLSFERQAKMARASVCGLSESGESRRGRCGTAYSMESILDIEQQVNRAVPWCPPPIFWIGMLLYIGAGALYVMALTYAPETTVAPLGIVQVMANVPLAYGVAHERFSRNDLLATIVCVVGMMAAVFAMPRNIPAHLKDFPITQFMSFCDDMTNNYGFLTYVICWTVLVVVCLNGHCVVRSKVQRSLRAFTMPTLTGLFTSAASFLLKLVGTLYYHSDGHPEVWHHLSAHLMIGSMVIFCVLSLVFVFQGVKNFDCRFFVPASFAVSTVLMIVQGFLFFREWDGMTHLQLLSFTVACILTVSSVFFISSERNTVHKPASYAAGLDTEVAAALAGAQPTPQETAVLTIMEEHGTRAIEKSTGWQLETPHQINLIQTNGAGSDSESSESDSGESASEMGPAYANVAVARRWIAQSSSGKVWNIICRIHPLLLFILIPGVPLLLFKLGYAWQAFTLLTIYSGYNCWKFGLHIALFSNVGRMKTKAYSKVHFESMFAKLADYPESPEAKAPFGFNEVLHFVILTNYKEDLGILKEAIMSVADSGIARRQIGLVLAMEEREEGAAEKAEQLIKEIGPNFRHMLYTLHPPGLPGEVPGKSANCRWAAQRLFAEHLPQLGCDLKRVVLTVMDADSEFHKEYFAALSYQFLTAPGDEARYNTIWQAPIIHYKNYHSQPAIVRLGSLLTSQHELANLADPHTTRMPYSTYSISAVLARAVDGWDPDWISEDWHMACKCFLSTMGSLNIAPIFLPVLNYTPEADSWAQTLWARWTQGKRHALGVSELVYFAGSMPRIVADRDFARRRRCRLSSKGYFLWVKMALVHGMMATAVLMGPINGIVISYFYRNQLANVSSFTFLANCIFQVFSLSTFVFYLYTNVRLYDTVAPRIVGYDDPGTRAWWGRHSLHFLSLVVGCGLMAPVLFFMGALCEWIAAVKTAGTHKFDYEVALKPQSASAMVGPS